MKEFTVVADAAMISSGNIRQLTQNSINYIVGARLGNIPAPLFETIDKTIAREDGKSIRLKTDNGYLICSYSSVRYRKDKYEMEKQIDLPLLGATDKTAHIDLLYGTCRIKANRTKNRRFDPKIY